MAGSSMDGLDLTFVRFSKTFDGWTYNLKKSDVFEYPTDLYNQLRNSTVQSKSDQEKLDVVFGNWIAKSIFVFKEDIADIDLLGVHGHTIIHEIGRASCRERV